MATIVDKRENCVTTEVSRHACTLNTSVCVVTDISKNICKTVRFVTKIIENCTNFSTVDKKYCCVIYIGTACVTRSVMMFKIGYNITFTNQICKKTM